MKIGVLGAGAWGTAVAARAAAAGHDTRLWARDPAQAAAIRVERVNRRYLPGVVLPAGLAVDDDLSTTLAHGREGLTLIAAPMSALAELLAAAAHDAPLLWLCKGFEAASGRLGHEIARERRPLGRTGVLSGPSFAQEVADGRPTALVAASTDAAVADAAVAALHSDTLRIYTSDDPVGVEVGGAVKNVVAIAAGICDGLGLGLNARAALLTRALAEITRLGVALGARAETFMGLSGLGDLVLTATGDLSRNRQVGLSLARGQPLARIVADLGHVAEGVSTAPMVARRARELGVETPITDVVVDVLQGRLQPALAVARLMGREARPEADVQSR